MKAEFGQSKSNYGQARAYFYMPLFTAWQSLEGFYTVQSTFRQALETVKWHRTMPPSEVSFLPPNLSRALTAAFEALEALKHEGLITRYDQEPFEEEGIYHLTAYAKDPNKVNRELGSLSARLSLEFDLPLYVLVSREPDA